MKGYSVIGKRFPRIDAPQKATGKAKYTTDMILPEMLHGRILRSPLAHAKISIGRKEEVKHERVFSCG